MNIVEFTKQFNAKTADMGDTIVPVVITVYAEDVYKRQKWWCGERTEYGN